MLAASITSSITSAIGNHGLYVVGAAIGWAIGTYAEVGLERRGRLLHVTPARLERAERWFGRFGVVAVPVGFVTPGIRSFVAIPAGIGQMPFRRFLPLAALGCAVFCFGLAAVGWAVGSSYGSVRRYLDYVVIAAILLLVAWLVARWRRSTRLARRGPDPAG